MTTADELDPRAREVLLRVAAYGLAPREDPIGPLTDSAWASLLIVTQTERMAGLLDRAIADGSVRSTRQQAIEAERAAVQGARGALRVERMLLDAAARLEREGVAFVVLKGPAVAHLDETDPAFREYADLDLLVSSDEIDAAVAALAHMGFQRDLPPRRPGFDRRFAKEVSLSGPHGLEIDVHRTLALGAFGLLLDLGELWTSTSSFELAGVQLRALDAEGRFVNACFNAVLGDPRPRLVALRDVVTIARSRELDAARLGRLAPDGRGAAVIREAVLRGHALVKVEPDEPARSFTRDLRVGRRERVALRAYRSNGGSNALELLSGALALSGRARWDYLRALLTPDPGYRRARARAGRPSEWRAGSVDVLRSLWPARSRAGAGTRER